MFELPEPTIDEVVDEEAPKVTKKADPFEKDEEEDVRVSAPPPTMAEIVFDEAPVKPQVWCLLPSLWVTSVLYFSAFSALLPDISRRGDSRFDAVTAEGNEE